MSMFDDEHSEEEDRWITLGLDRAGALLVASHTFREETETSAKIRLISARKANRREGTQYRGIWAMKTHYDFSKGERGKFYRKGATLRLPIYLNGQLQKRLERIAEKNGRDFGEVVEDVLTKEVELLEELTWSKQIGACEE
jgi:hypothetical protein